MQKRWLLIAAAAVLLLPGCLKSTFREEEPRLDVDQEEVILRARSGTGFVKDTVYVSANRSWSAALLEVVEDDWISVAVDGYENPSEVLRTAPLVVICKENPTYEPRSAVVVIYGADQQKTVTVSQKGIQKVDDVEGSGIDPYLFEDYETK